MTLRTTSFDDFTDEQLLTEVKRLAAIERSATAGLIQSLMELDTRRLYLREGCSSLFTYCTQVLHLAEGAAYNRIEAARAARRFPIILGAIADGSLTLTAVRLLSPHLTVENHQAVVASAQHKTKREVELLIATLSPKPPVPASIRKLPTPQNRPVHGANSHTPTAAASASLPPPLVPTPVPIAADLRTAIVTPLAPERFRIQFTISRDTHDKLRRVKDLLRHTIPSGDLSAIFDRALTLLLDDIERRRCATTPSPRAPRQSASRSRHIPAAVRRAVWNRDQGRCAFIGTNGRCGETGFLEFHHVEPYAVGGRATVETIELRCRAHNQYEAALFFGNEVVREPRLPWPSFESRDRHSGRPSLELIYRLPVTASLARATIRAGRPRPNHLVGVDKGSG